MISIAKAAATLATFTLLLYGTYVGLIKWIDTLPDPPDPSSSLSSTTPHAPPVVVIQ